MHGPKSVTWVQLVYGRWLLVASSDQSDSLLHLWDLAPFHDTDGGPETVAEVALSGPVKAGYIDHMDGDLVIALELREAW